MKLDAVIDELVARINATTKEPLFPEDVPEWLRVGQADNIGMFSWKIERKECKWIHELEQKLPKRLPPSFRSLISRYAFPGFQLGPVFLFANTGGEIFWELQYKIFADEVMSRILFQNGYFPFANPSEGDYDPICFDLKKGAEAPIVQIDHEGILLNSKIRVTEKIADSFVTLLHQHTRETA